jgi:hypothetical protein
MSGVFATAQPVYAERGIATFPLNDNKKPAITHYQKIGLPASSRLATHDRFRAVNGIGFMTNARSRVSVLDVDTTDERVLADAMGRHGSTPLVAKTASGKFHAFYRHNGEFRKIRPFGDLPIDLLGKGGLVVAAPSRFEKGAYSFLQGCLDDLERLPVMRRLDPAMYRPREAATVRAPPTVVGAFDQDIIAYEGARNRILWEYCMQQLALKEHDIDAIVAAARIRNSTYKPPLTDEEVIKIAASALGYTKVGRNWFGNGTVAIRHEEVDELADDEALLLMRLRRHNWGETFIITNAMAEIMGDGGWDRERFAAAKAGLERKGKIRCIRNRNGGRGAPLYEWV